MYIVATISKNSYAKEKIKEILLAGATVLRFNFSHGSPLEVQQKIATAREVISELGLVGRVKILADLPGGKIRLGSFTPAERYVTKGEVVLFKSATESADPMVFIPVVLKKVATFLKVGQIFTLGDGEIAFTVKKIIDEDSFEAEALNDRHIPSMKAINIGAAIDQIEHFTPQTLEHIENLKNIRPEMIAFSFVNSGEYIRTAKELLTKHAVDWEYSFVSKVESPVAMKNIEEIVQGSNVVLIARGDLGLSMPIEEIGVSQKRIAHMAKKYSKEFIVSTQMLDSLLSYYIPSRADVLDVTNAALDGASGIMLAKETGISATPGHSVAVAKKILETVLKEKDSFS